MTGIGAISSQSAMLAGNAPQSTPTVAEFKRNADNFFQQNPELADAGPLVFSHMSSEHGLRSFGTLLRSYEIELMMLDQVEQEADRLMEKSFANDIAKTDVNSRLASVNTLKTGFSLVTATIGMGAALILASSGQVPAALALGASSLTTLVSEIADQCGIYTAVGKSLSQDKETQATIAQAMRYGTAFISFATSVASGALGGLSPFKEAFQNAFGSQLQTLVNGAQSIVLFKKASIEKEKSVIEVEHLGLNMHLTLRYHERDRHDQNSQATLEGIEKVFGLRMKDMEMKRKLINMCTNIKVR